MADAIIVGAGICGASVAHFLAQRGLGILVLDRAGIAQGTSSRGEGNVLVCDKPEGTERELALRGRELWGSLGEQFPAGRVTRKGALLLNPPSADGGDDLRQLEPELAAGVTGLLDADDLQVDPPGMTRALLTGISVRCDVDVIEVEAHAVRLASGERLVADHVVVAGGPWSGPLTGLPIEPRKGQLVALAAPPNLIVHKLIEAAYMDAVAGADAGLTIAAVVEQTLDGDEILVGSSRARLGFDATVDPLVTEAMIARAARFVPCVAELPITRSWCGWRPWLPDGLPAIGQLRSGVWTSTGHEGAGVCLGPISGLLLAQQICGEEPVLDPSPFSPLRF